MKVMWRQKKKKTSLYVELIIFIFTLGIMYLPKFYGGYMRIISIKNVVFVQLHSPKEQSNNVNNYYKSDYFFQ